MQRSDLLLFQQAEGFVELGLPVQALDRLRRVTAQARPSFEWNFWMGELLRQTEEYGQAIPYLERARNVRPEVITTYINLGWCLKRTDQLDGAIGALLAAEEQCRAHDSGAEHALVMYNLACYHSLAGQKERMLEWLSAALAREPSYRELVISEPDFDPFRNDPDLARLLGT